MNIVFLSRRKYFFLIVSFLVTSFSTALTGTPAKAGAAEQTLNGGTASIYCPKSSKGLVIWNLTANSDLLISTELTFLFSSGVVKQQFRAYLPNSSLDGSDVSNRTEQFVTWKGSVLGLAKGYSIPPFTCRV
jgi:hypothetical protein